MSTLQSIWKDPVGSNVIGGAILLAVGWIGTSLSGLKWDHPVSIPLWLIVLWGVQSAVTVLYIVRATLAKSAANGQPSQPVKASPQKKVTIERLTDTLKIRYDFVARAGTTPRTGQNVWHNSYIEMFRLLGPKLLVTTDEGAVKRYLDKALKDDSSGSLDTVHVVDADFQSMKIKLHDIGVITLTEQGNAMHWGLTSSARDILPKLHEGRSMGRRPKTGL